MSLTYTTYTAQIANLMVQSTTDPNFITMEPGMIDYAEQRIYRELDLQVSRVVDATTAFQAGSRNFTLPTSIGVFVVVEQINAITPAGTAAASGTRSPLIPVTKEFLDSAWPSAATNTGIPQYFAPLNNTTVILGPAPDSAYVAEVIGTQRPAPLSASNPTTFLTLYLPDLFIAASMVFASAYQRDFSAMADDPAKSSAWEMQYQKLFQSANAEELRKRFMSQGWQSMTVSQTATPARV